MKWTHCVWLTAHRRYRLKCYRLLYHSNLQNVFSHSIQKIKSCRTEQQVSSSSQCCSLSTGRTGEIFYVCPVESQESLQPFLLPEQQPGEFSPLLCCHPFRFWATAVAMLYFSKLISVFWIITHISEIFSESFKCIQWLHEVLRSFHFLHVQRFDLN